MRQLVCIKFIANNRASFHSWWKENLIKHQKVSKYYENNWRSCFCVLLTDLSQTICWKTNFKWCWNFIWETHLWYLRIRKQRSNLRNNCSSWRNMLYGVIEVSTLVPLVFNIYIWGTFFLLNDMHEVKYAMTQYHISILKV